MTDRQREILGILLIALGIFVLLSIISYNPGEEPTIAKDLVIDNWMGILGIIVSSALVRFTLGYVSFIFPVLLLIWGWWVFAKKPIRSVARFSVYVLILSVITSAAMGLPDAMSTGDIMFEYRYSGLVGGVIARVLHDFLGLWGAIIVLVVGTIATLRGYFSWSLYSPFEVITEYWENFREKRRHKKIAKQAAEEDTQEDFPTFSGEEPATGIQTEPGIRPELQADAHEKRKSKKSTRKKLDRTKTSASDEEETTDSANTGSFPTGDHEPSEPVTETPAERVDSTEPTPEERHSDEHTIENDISPEPGPQSTGSKSAQGTEADDYSMDEEIIEKSVDFDAAQDKAKRREYKLPSSDLLIAPDEVEEGASREELVENARLLERSLLEFGVEAKVVHISPGPIITRYELEPAKGVRINKFTSLADDLARVMRAQRVRVLAPIPGKAAVGIEIPNKHGATVYLKHIINSDAFVSAEHALTIAMGKTTSGEAYVANLAKMPHVLIAGATGSGKSVCINTMIMSLLYRAKPTELKFIMVDPKKLELSVYQALEGYHLITSEDLDEYVITKPSNAVTALRSAEIEMERRYELLADAAVRDIDEYNKRVAEGRHEGEHLPYIVVVIDELADLMITASKEVEEPIARIAQMARAVGIHLIIATQRPSVDVLTGVIKANFPARIAFQVASKTDSRTILDANGAEKLLGKGDMLYLPPAQPEPIRLHNSFVSLEEIESVLDHVNGQPKAEELELPSLNEATDSTSFSIGHERDELFFDALKLVVTHQQGSISLLQRRLRIGYSRAARIIDELEEAGIVGGHEGSKARDVLADESIIEDIENGEIDI
mgnify:CR=1 FL=1